MGQDNRARGLRRDGARNMPYHYENYNIFYRLFTLLAKDALLPEERFRFLGDRAFPYDQAATALCVLDSARISSGHFFSSAGCDVCQEACRFSGWCRGNIIGRLKIKLKGQGRGRERVAGSAHFPAGICLFLTKKPMGVHILTISREHQSPLHRPMRRNENPEDDKKIKKPEEGQLEAGAPGSRAQGTPISAPPAYPQGAKTQKMMHK